jgi:hypothetical protein
LVVCFLVSLEGQIINLYKVPNYIVCVLSMAEVHIIDQIEEMAGLAEIKERPVEVTFGNPR